MSERLRLKREKQCAKCPWKKSTKPHEIPDGYSEERHRALKSTIAEPGDHSGLSAPIRVMACHETESAHCIGWLMNQLGPGNNIPLRFRMRDYDLSRVALAGPQHACFDDTLPSCAGEAESVNTGIGERGKGISLENETGDLLGDLMARVGRLSVQLAVAREANETLGAALSHADDVRTTLQIMRERLSAQLKVARKALEYARDEHSAAFHISGSGIDGGAVCRKAIQALAEIDRIEAEVTK